MRSAKIRGAVRWRMAPPGIIIIAVASAGLGRKNWLGGKDSNLRYRIQSPGPYRLATAQPLNRYQQNYPDFPRRSGLITNYRSSLPSGLLRPPVSASTFSYSA